ncbi:MAG: lipoyl synthase, partial [Thermodesulfobacteriota bacterium]|nr:lipoyl synthase [Thermodesulfobacteriota bacterium]
MNHMTQIRTQKPQWLRRSLPKGSEYQAVRKLLRESQLHTVCEEALCPNIWECFSRRTATFLIMGSLCTRGCRFCAMSRGKPAPPDLEEPSRVAGAARKLGLDYIVITSVTRDDLPDGGASFFSDTIINIRNVVPGAHVEALIPDFQGDAQALATVIVARPDVLNHNIETVPRLYPAVRPDSSYRRSLALLEQIRKDAPAIPVKSGIMLGLGETSKEIKQTLCDLLDAGCDILTMGQYLQASKKNLPVERFVHPDEFDKWRATALDMGFSGVVSGPLVRSSYHARELYDTVMDV